MITNLTAVYKKVTEGYIGYVEELPGANAQGLTLDEVKQNLREAVLLVLETNREISRIETPENPEFEETFSLSMT